MTKRVPRGYVSAEAQAAVRSPASAVDQDVAEFEQHYGYKRRQPGSCLVCDSDYRALIDVLLAKGASRRALRAFLEKKYGMKVGETTLDKHHHDHMADDAT